MTTKKKQIVKKIVEKNPSFRLYLERQRKANGHKLSYNTITAYMRVINRVSDSITVTKLPHDIAKQCNEVINDYYCATTYYAIRMYLNYLQLYEVIPLLNKPPQIALTESELHDLILTRQELRMLCGYSTEVRLIIYLYYDTAMRREAIIFKVKDIHPDTNRVLIHEKEQTVALVDVHPRTMQLLVKRTKGMNPNEVAMNMSSKTISRRLSVAAVSVLGKHIHPHQIRHSVLQHLADDGTDWIELMHFARHKNPNTTKRYISMAGHMRRKVFHEKHKSLTVA